MRPPEQLSRRDFLKLASRFLPWLAGLLGVGVLVRYFSFSPDAGPADRFVLGPADDFPIGTVLLRPDIPALIENRDGKVRATSLTCTHLGCTVEQSEGGFTCPCHGSRFDSDGRVLVGPARQALAQPRVEAQEDGTLILDLGGEQR